MRYSASSWFLFVTLAFAPSARDADAATTPPAAPAERVGKLFSRWDHDTTPGGVVAVVREGAVVHRRAFGMANLDFGVANTPQTLFHIASVSKQFTAFAVLLLQQDGKVSLDDDVRKYVPEMPDFGHRVTIRHLLHHTSGLRDQPHLMWMAGWRFEDEVTMDDALRLASRQRTLNFAPGEESMYSNTGFTLLAIIVERVAGKSLAEFSRERIFQPLGMSHTLIQDDHHRVVKGRATSYRPARGGGYECMSFSDSTAGQTGVVCDVEDLAKWDRNFDEATVGGKALVAEMLTPGCRNDGQATRYAAGVGIDQYRGTRIEEHSGSIAGYRCHYARFPGHRLAVIVLGNTEDLPATDLAHQVADIYLEKQLTPRQATADASPAPAPPVPVEVPSAVLDAYVGDYQLSPGDYVTISRDGARLMVQGTGSGKVEMTPESQTSFLLPRKGASVAFVRPDGAAPTEAIRVILKGKERLARRITAPSTSELVGSYYSPELGVIYEVKSRGGKLYLAHPRGDVEMTFTTPDMYDLPFPMKTIRFERDGANRGRRFVIEAERVRNVRFDRVELGG
jgi:CubicO group peptidase (beta-lactamase class C family)